MGLPQVKLCGGVLRNHDLLRPCLLSYCINPYTSSLNSAFFKLAELVPGSWTGTCKDKAAAASSSPRRDHEADLWLVSCLCFVRRGDGRSCTLMSRLPSVLEWTECGPGSKDGHSPHPAIKVAAAASPCQGPQSGLRAFPYPPVHL